MTAAPRSHIIQRQTFEVTVPSEAAARRIHAEIGRVQGSALAEVVDRCCSAASEPDAIYRIPTLQVDLGVVDPRDFEGDLVRRLLDRLPAALEQALSPGLQVGGLRRSPGGGGLAPPPGESHEIDDSDAPTTLDTVRLIEVIAVFAQTGTLPWWTRGREQPDLKELVRHLLVAAPAELVQTLREVATTRRHLERFVVAMDDELLAAVGDVAAPEAASTLPLGELATLFQRVPAWATSKRPARNTWAMLLQVALADVHRSSIELINASVAQAADEANIPTVLIADKLLDAALSLPASSGVIAQIQGSDGVTRREDTRPPGRATDPEGAENVSARADPGSVEGPARPDRSAAHSGTSPGRAEVHLAADESTPPQVDMPPALAKIDLSFSESDRVYVENAGLVILAPFLDTFFSRLGLVRGAQFESPEAKHRAVGLLQYLAAGAVTPLEQSVPLNKVLCGLEVLEVFDFGEPVTDREAEECTDLLAAVIEHAAAFGDVSTAGFQSTFLQRPGALSSEPGSWILRVERETQDVLLGRLPWSFDWVALPWMGAPLGVEW